MNSSRLALMGLTSILLVLFFLLGPMTLGKIRVPGTDYLIYHLPSASIWVEAWKHGQVPFTNSLCNLGEPFLAIPSNQPLYPLKFLLLAFRDLNQGMGLFMGLHLLLLGLAIYPWCRNFTTSGALAFTVTAMLITSPALLSWSPMIPEFCALPWALALIWPVIPSGSSRTLGLITGSRFLRALFLALCVYAGSPELALGALAFLFLSNSMFSSRDRILLTAGGLLLSLPVLIPFIQWVPLSSRPLEMAAMAASYRKKGFHFPWSLNQSMEFLAAPGPFILVPALAALGTFRSVLRSVLIPSLIISVAALTVSLGIFPSAAATWIPRYPGKFLLFALPLMAVLSVRGLELSPFPAQLRRIVAAAALLSLLMTWNYCGNVLLPAAQPIKGFTETSGRKEAAATILSKGLELTERGLSLGSTWKGAVLPLDSSQWFIAWAEQLGPGYPQTLGIRGPVHPSPLPSRMQWWSAMMLSNPSMARMIPSILGLGAFISDQNEEIVELTGAASLFLDCGFGQESGKASGNSGFLPRLPRTRALKCSEFTSTSQGISLSFTLTGEDCKFLKTTANDGLPEEASLRLILPAPLQPGIRIQVAAPPIPPLDYAWEPALAGAGPLGTTSILFPGTRGKVADSAGCWRLRATVLPWPWNLFQLCVKDPAVLDF